MYISMKTITFVMKISAPRMPPARPHAAQHAGGQAVAVDRQRPAAEEEADHQAAVDDHRRVFGEHEEGELHRRVLGVIAGHQLRLRFRQIERRAVVLRVHRHEEDERGDELREEIPDVISPGS